MTEFSVSRAIERCIKYTWKSIGIGVLCIAGAVLCASCMKRITSGSDVVGDAYRLAGMALASSFFLGFAIAYGIHCAARVREKICIPSAAGIAEIFCDMRDWDANRDTVQLFRKGIIAASFFAAILWCAEANFWMTADSTDFIETGFFQHYYPFLMAAFFFVQGAAASIWQYKAVCKNRHDEKPYF